MLMRKLSTVLAAACIALYITPFATAVEPLTDASVSRMFPVLRGLGETLKARPVPGSILSVREKKAVEAYLALIDSMKAGEVDPLEWLRKHAPNLKVPPLIAYGPECSRIATGLAMRPTAVFSFGIEASEYGLSLIMPDPAVKKGSEPQPNDTAAQRKVRGMVNAMQTYFNDEGFPGFTNDVPLYWTTVSRDSTVLVTVVEANVYLSWGCGSMPTGPIVELALNETPEGVGATFGSVSDRTAFLIRPGVEEADILSMLTALATARKDSRDPALLTLDDSLPMNTEEGKKLFEQVKKIVTVRKANVLVYRKYASAVDPLLDLFEKE